MAQKQFKIGLSNTDKQNMAQDVYERLLALTFPEYDTTTEYEVGDFVVYNDQLYKCIGATSGAWDSTKWQLATLNDLVTDIENAVAFVNDKANVNGNYPTMTVGFADNLTPYDESAGDDQDEPFSLQATGTGNGTQPDFSTGSGALMKEKQGNTVVVNQVIPNANKTKTIDTSDTSIVNLAANVSVVQGQKWLMIWNQSKTLTSNTRNTPNYKIGDNTRVYQNATENANLSAGIKFWLVTIGNTGLLELSYWGNTPNEEYQITDISFVNLTQWFNGDIPSDLEQNPSNFFRYYQGSLAYNTGELVNANGRYIKCIGMNQFDGTNDVKAIPNATYYINGSATLTYKDREGNTISSESKSNQTFVAPSNCLSIGVSGSGDISINLYYEDEPRCLTYEPYEVLTNNDTGTEVLRKAGNVCDIKLPSGEIKRNVGTITLDGSDDENYSSTTYERFSFGVSDWTSPNANTVGAISCNRLVAVSKNNMPSNNYCISGTNEGAHSMYIRIDSTIDTVEKLRTWLSGHPLTIYYELAEETTEQGTPYSENLVIDDFGSMDFGSDVPQGALIFYPVDYKAFVDTLYNYTDGTPSNIALKSDLNNYQPIMQDLSSEITDAAGLTYTIKKAYKIGNQVFLTIKATNSTGNAISQFTSLASLGASIKPSTNLPVSSYIGETSARFIVHSDGYLSCASEIANDSTIYIVISYAVS